MKRIRSFDDQTHFFGRIWGIVAAVLILSYPFVCLFLFDAQIDWKTVATGVGVVGLYWVVGAVETFTYTPMLGSGGTYLGFVTGNLSNLKVPCALNCMEQAGVEQGTEEAEVISTIAIAVSSIVTVLILTFGALGLGLLAPVLDNPTLKPAFDNVLYALFGGMAVVYVSKNWKISVLPCAIMLIVFISASFATGDSALAGTLIGVMVPVGVVVTVASARFMYKKGWLGELEAAQPDGQKQTAAADAAEETIASGPSDNAQGFAAVAETAEADKDCESGACETENVQSATKGSEAKNVKDAKGAADLQKKK